jgi:CheY-like chemotaxis protein
MSRHTVLVVDDSEDLLQLFAFMLESEACNPVTASSGVQAIEKASLFQPDLIFMDIRMPVMDGYEATRQILSMPELSKVPVVAISAHCTGDWERRALDAGCKECVPKPVDPSQLHDIITRYIGNCE